MSSYDSSNHGRIMVTSYLMSAPVISRIYSIADPAPAEIVPELQKNQLLVG